MVVAVQFFAIAKDLAGCAQTSVELPDGACVADLRARLAAEFPRLAPMLERSMIAVDEEYAEADRCLPPGAVVACIPPVSGGSGPVPSSVPACNQSLR